MSDEGSPLPIQESLEVCAYNNDGGSEVSLKVKSQHLIDLSEYIYSNGYIVYMLSVNTEQFSFVCA